MLPAGRLGDKTILGGAFQKEASLQSKLLLSYRIASRSGFELVPRHGIAQAQPES